MDTFWDGTYLHTLSPGLQPFGFAGGLYDPDAKLVHFGAREYDPSIGRWLQRHPIGFKGGDTNLYGYVLSDPINSIDPNGLNPADLGACIDPYRKERDRKNAEALEQYNNTIFQAKMGGSSCSASTYAAASATYHAAVAANNAAFAAQWLACSEAT